LINTLSTTLKIAAFAPIPTANVLTATVVKRGARASRRTAIRNCRASSST
jgi:hypothetical protein